jgi:hypothetical protein
VSYSCPYEMERIGRMGDGGEWACGMSLYEEIPAEKPCVIYSLGVRTELGFGECLNTKVPFTIIYELGCVAVQQADELQQNMKCLPVLIAKYGLTTSPWLISASNSTPCTATAHISCKSVSVVTLIHLRALRSILSKIS